MAASWRSTLSLPVYASDAARRFECADVGQGGSADLDPQLIAMLGGEMAQRSVAYATLVDLYKASHPDADMADIVNNLVAAYCPVVAKSGGSDQEKSLAVKRFALDITSYLSNQSVVAEAEPDVGIIWAVPVGYSLAERDPGWQPALKCPANDNSRVPASLVAAAVQIRGKPDLNFLAPAAIAQADSMLAQNPKAKPADLANALILAYCEGRRGPLERRGCREERRARTVWPGGHPGTATQGGNEGAGARGQARRARRCWRAICSIVLTIGLAR